MPNGQKGLLRISLAGRGHMLITLELHGIFGSNFTYLYNLTLSRHCYAKRCQGFAVFSLVCHCQ